MQDIGMLWIKYALRPSFICLAILGNIANLRRQTLSPYPMKDIWHKMIKNIFHPSLTQYMWAPPVPSLMPECTNVCVVSWGIYCCQVSHFRQSQVWRCRGLDANKQSVQDTKVHHWPGSQPGLDCPLTKAHLHSFLHKVESDAANNSGK